MAQQILLLVDSDVQHVRVMEVSLRKAGYVIATARDGADALAKLASAQPDLIISDTAMPNLSGFELCRRIKGGSHRNIPFLFLTEDNTIESKVKGLELGADDYLIRPIYTRELAARVAMILEKRDREALEKPSEQQRYFGDLSNMGVVDLLQAMESGTKSGTVYIDRSAGRGTLWFRDGNLIDANAGNIQGADAVYRMLTWDQGRFEIDFRPPRRPEAMNTPVHALVAEGMRQTGSWSEIAEQLPSLETVFKVDYAELADRIAELPDHVNALIRLFDGRRTAREAITQSGLADLMALETTSQLYFEGIIAVAEQIQEPAADAPVPTYETSLPPAVKPSVADALLQSVEQMTGQPISAPPVPSSSVPVEPAQPVQTEPSAPPRPAITTAAPPIPQVEQTSTAASAQPPPPPPEAMGDLTDAVASIAEVQAPVATDEPEGAAPEATPTPPAGDSVWDLTNAAKKSQERAETASKSLKMALMPEEEENVFPEFNDNEKFSEETEEEAFFSTGGGFGAPVEDNFDVEEEEESIDIELIDQKKIKPKAPRMALYLGILIVVAGAAFVFLQDTIEPMVVPKNSLDSNWAKNSIKKLRPVGAVAAIDAGWLIPSEPDGGLIAEPEKPEDDAGQTPAATDAGVQKPPTKPKEAASAVSAPAKPTTKKVAKAKEPAAAIEAPKVDANKAKTARGLTAEGIKLYKRGKYKAAVGKFEKALSAAPGAKSTLVAYTKALLETNRIRDALEAAEKASRVDKNNAEVFLLLGNARQDLGMNKTSIAAYERYLKLAPNGAFAAEVRQVIKGMKASPQ